MGRCPRLVFDPVGKTLKPYKVSVIAKVAFDLKKGQPLSAAW